MNNSPIENQTEFYAAGSGIDIPLGIPAFKEVGILRKNNRNITLECEMSGKRIFVKKSVFGGHPDEELFFWQYFYAVDPTLIPKCVFSNHITGSIGYEWLDNYTQLDMRYTKATVKRLADFLAANAKINTYARLSVDDRLVKISDRRHDEQMEFFSKVEKDSAGYFSSLSSLRRFREIYRRAIEDLLCGETLCHCDMGKSNILTDDRGGIKIVDFEYSMFSEKEVDPGRIFSTLLLAYLAKKRSSVETADLFNVLLAPEYGLRIGRLMRLAGLQLSMRLLQSSRDAITSPEDAYRKTFMLLSADDKAESSDFLHILD